VYVASPLGFSAAGRAYYPSVLQALREASLEPLDPWDGFDAAEALELLGDPRRAIGDWNRIGRDNLEVGERNTVMIRQAKGVLAILDGADVDSGTAAEIGYASACQIPIVGLKTDIRYCGDNAATPVNLQVVHFIRASAGIITYSLDDAIAALVARLDRGQ
jgi:nucleoside 2-deoxyribosyltransferase